MSADSRGNLLTVIPLFLEHREGEKVF